MKADKRHLFTIKDFEVQTFRSGGPGGQHQNRRDTGVRIVHKDSGARGESREHRSQHANKHAAFKRLVETREFTIYVRTKAARARMDLSDIERRVKKSTERKNLRIETVGPDGKWIEEENGEQK